MRWAADLTGEALVRRGAIQGVVLNGGSAWRGKLDHADPQNNQLDKLYIVSRGAWGSRAAIVGLLQHLSDLLLGELILLLQTDLRV
jgi:hypothetical protein